MPEGVGNFYSASCGESLDEVPNPDARRADGAVAVIRGARTGAGGER